MSPRARARVLLGAAGAFVVLTALAIATYHGGSRLAPAAPDYEVLGNFLSDLGTTVTYNGITNTVPRTLFVVATSVLGLGLLWSAPIWSSAASDRRGTRAALVASLSIAIAGVGFVAVGLVPWNRDLALHVHLVQAVFLALLAFAASLVVLRAPERATIAFRSAVLLFGVLVAYTLLIAFGPGLGSGSGIVLQVTAQKLVVVLLVVVVAWQVRSLAPRRRPGWASTPTATEPAVRLPGVDLARAVAMLGMLVVHTRDNAPVLAAPDRALMWVNVWVGPLFVLVAGVGLTLGWRHRRTTRFRTTVLLRAAALLLIGLWLESLFLGSILQYFAVYFALGVLVLRARTRVLVGLSAACLVLGPLLITYLVHTGSITLFLGADRGVQSLVHPVALARALTVDGLYPAVVWGGFFLAGMAIGRLDLRDRRVATRLALGGGVLGATGCLVGWLAVRAFGSEPYAWTHHWTSAAHSESITWALTALALACGFLGASLLVTRRVDAGNRAFVAVLALAQMPLSFYLLHLWYSDTLWWDLSPLLTTTAAFVASTLVTFALFALGARLWLRVFRRGPAELLVEVPIRWVVRPRPVPVGAGAVTARDRGAAPARPTTG